MSSIELLLNATQNNNLKEVLELIEDGIDVNQLLEDNDTVLMFAASKGYIDIVKALVEAGANIDLVSYQGDNALKLAASGGWQEVFDYLASLVSLETKKLAEKDALLGAASDGETKIIQLLSKAGADLNVKDDIENDRTALMIASEFRNIEFVEALIKAGAEISLKDHQGKTALILATRFCNSTEAHMDNIVKSQIKIVNLLFEAGINLNDKDNEGKTAVIHAAEFGSPQVLKLLIELGASVNEKDNKGMSALDYGKQLNNLFPFEKAHRSQIINLLENAGATET